jgi:hypothetical protein
MIGFFAGFMVCTKVGVTVAVVVMERQQALTVGKPLWPVYAAMTIHSGPWLLAITVGAGVLFATANAPPPWGRIFIYGFSSGALVYALLLTASLFRFRSKRQDTTS